MEAIKSMGIEVLIIPLLTALFTAIVVIGKQFIDKLLDLLSIKMDIIAMQQQLKLRDQAIELLERQVYTVVMAHMQSAEKMKNKNDDNKLTFEESCNLLTEVTRVILDTIPENLQNIIGDSVHTREIIIKSIIEKIIYEHKQIKSDK